MPSPDPRIDATIEPAPLVDQPWSATGGGAVCSFVGTTRPERHPDLGPLVALDYESAGPLADATLRDLARAVADRHELIALRIRHAVGRVPIGEASVRIDAIAAHRGAAFDGCREAIDRLKREVPIWKRECWHGGSTWSSTTAPLAPTAATPVARTSESAR